MKAFHLVLSATGQAVSDLHFLDRADADHYQKFLLWPWQELGYFQTQDGQKHPLETLKLRAEQAIVHGVHAEDLDWILWKHEGSLGYAPLLPGRCFNPESWRALQERDLQDPILAPKIAEAERRLGEMNEE